MASVLRFVKYYGLALCIPFCHLFNLSLSSRCLPFECHACTPDRSLVTILWSTITGQFPFLVLFPKFSSVLFATSVMTFKCNNMSVCQYGFLLKTSTLQQLLLKLLCCIYELCEWKMHVDVIYMDFCKAFDSVPYCEPVYGAYI